MTTLRELLEAKIKADSISNTCSLSDSNSYRQGAHSVLNLILEMDDALKRLGYGIDCLDCEIENDQVCAHHLYETINIAKEARQKLAAWAKGE